MQTRAIRHQMGAAVSVLGYQPELGFEASMVGFARWYEIHHGSGDDDWPLLARLWSPPAQPT